MDRRLLAVLSISLLLALVVSAVFYQVVAAGRRGKATATRKIPTRDLVVATRMVSAGSSIKAEDLRLIQMPVDQFPKGCFSRLDEVLDRPVASAILQDEPVREGRLAQRGSGSGLAPMIPEGLRAVPVKVNEVVGVAGFAVPGIRVDVLVTGRLRDSELTLTRTVLQDILVLSAGQKLEADAQGKPIQAQVVTLLVTPAQAETVTLAGAEGKIQLVLRNGADHKIGVTPGSELAQLYGVQGKPALKPAPAAVRPSPPKVELPHVAAPEAQQVVVIRGNQRTVETVLAKKEAGGREP